MADQTNRDLAHYEATERRKDLHWRASFDLIRTRSNGSCGVEVGRQVAI
jgi:hypothetical protein